MDATANGYSSQLRIAEWRWTGEDERCQVVLNVGRRRPEIALTYRSAKQSQRFFKIAPAKIK